MSFSIWVGLGQAVNTINWRFDQLLAGYMLGNAQLGYYSVGDRLAVLPTREATQPVAQAVFPGFARLADDPPRLRAALPQGADGPERRGPSGRCRLRGGRPSRSCCWPWARTGGR